MGNVIHLLFRYPVKILFTLIIISILFLLITISQVKILLYEPCAFFYFYSMPPSYWIGIVICILIMIIVIILSIHDTISGKVKILIEIAFLFVLALYLFGLPSFIYSNLRFIDSYAVVSNVNNLMIASKTNLSGAHGYVTQYPGLYFFSANISFITNIAVMAFAKYFPILLMFSIGLFLYSIGDIFSYKYKIIAPLVYYSLSWVQEYHFAPQGFSIIYYVFFLLLVLNILLKKKTKNPAWIVIILIVILATTISHAGTPVFIILSALSLSIIAKFASNHKSTWIKSEQKLYYSSLFNLLFLILIIWLSWLAFISNWTFNLFVTQMNNAIFGLFQGGASLNIVFLFNPTPDLRWASNIRIGITGISILFTMVCTAYLWLIKSRFFTSFLIGIFIGCLAFAIYSPLIGGYYFGRFFIMSLVPSSLILTLAFSEYMNRQGQEYRNHTKKIEKVVIASIIIFVIFNIITIPISRYADDPLEFQPDSSIKLNLYSSIHDIAPARPDFIEEENIHEYEKYEYNYYNYYYIKYQLHNEYRNYLTHSEKNRIYNSHTYFVLH